MHKYLSACQPFLHTLTMYLSRSLTDLRDAGQSGFATAQPPATARWSGQDSILNTLVEESQAATPPSTLGVPQR